VPLFALFAIFLLAVPLAAEAQAPAKVPRIGFLSVLSLTNNPHDLEAFRQGLRELGYVEGQNIAIEYRFAEGRPGGNITGLSSMAPEVVGKQLELLKEVAPKISRMAVLQNPSNQAHPPTLRQAEGAARTLGLQLHIVQAGTPAEIDAALATMSSQRAGGVLVLRDSFFLAQRAQIAVLAAKDRLPSVSGLREQAEAGGLMAYGASTPPMYRRAATYVDKILKGAKPADLPVEQPTKFELVINLKTAKALGLTIPQSVLGRADEVIQ
jgi:putative ABC transport system substrate-binding protein